MARECAKRLRVGSCVSILAAAASPAAFAGDWYVDVNGANCATATGGATDPFCSLGDALAVAVDGDTIHVAAGTYFENVVIAADVTLLGTSGAASTTIDGSSAGTVIEIASDAVVVLDGFTITHGFAGFGTSGGGILVRKRASLAITDSVVQDNTADPAGGGGIKVEKAVLTLDRCSVLDNHAKDYGGGIFNDGGTVSIAASSILRNTNGDGWNVARGAGISSRNGTLTVTDSRVETNSAFGVGGGIYVYSGSATVTQSTI